MYMTISSFILWLFLPTMLGKPFRSKNKNKKSHRLAAVLERPQLICKNSYWRRARIDTNDWQDKAFWRGGRDIQDTYETV